MDNSAAPLVARTVSLSPVLSPSMSFYPTYLVQPSYQGDSCLSDLKRISYDVQAGYFVHLTQPIRFIQLIDDG